MVVVCDDGCGVGVAAEDDVVDGPAVGVHVGVGNHELGAGSDDDGVLALTQQGQVRIHGTGSHVKGIKVRKLEQCLFMR